MDEQKMEEIYQQYFPMIYNYVFCRLMHRADTEDVVSHIFMKVFSNLRRFDPEKSAMKTWIFRIAKNVMIDHYRKRRASLSLDGCTDAAADEMQVHFDAQYEYFCQPRRQMILEALQQLPERDRMLIYYRYYLHMRNRELARMLGMKENTVSAALHRARVKLRDLLADEILE